MTFMLNLKTFVSVGAHDEAVSCRSCSTYKPTGSSCGHSGRKDKKGQLEATTEVHSKYYTDHKCIAIMLKKKLRAGEHRQKRNQ